MPTQLTLPLFHNVRRMLRAGLRHCEIARETELSVWTISRLANDPKFRDEEPHTNPTRQRGSAGSALANLLANDETPADNLTAADLPEDDGPPDYVAKSLRRCTSCGGMVYQWPCLTCQSRALSELRARHVAQARHGRRPTRTK